jgi:Glu-tRNA(Gln) amidotransferase subunit E-like FAD-binding protein
MEKGYRTENLFGEGFREAAPVMAHEIFELYNVDILDTLSSTIFKNSTFGRELEAVSKYIEDEDSREDDFDELYDLLDEAFEDSDIAKKYCEKILEKIEEVTGKKVNYVLWLCDTIEDVKFSYEDLDAFPDIILSEFDEYETSNVIISDLGKGGKLYGYEIEPKCLKTIVYKCLLV